MSVSSSVRMPTPVPVPETILPLRLRLSPELTVNPPAGHAFLVTGSRALRTVSVTTVSPHLHATSLPFLPAVSPHGAARATGLPANDASAAALEATRRMKLMTASPRIFSATLRQHQNRGKREVCRPR